jgi:hypothetical protein
MHDAGGVRGADTFSNLNGDVECVCHRHRPLVQDLPERTPRYQLHDEDVGAVRRKDVEDCDDMRIVQRRSGPRFVQEAGTPLLVVALVRWQDLERYAAIETLVDRFVDHAHPAGAQLGDDLVMHQRAAEHVKTLYRTGQ